MPRQSGKKKQKKKAEAPPPPPGAPLDPHAPPPPGAVTDEGVSVEFLENFGLEVKGKLKRRGDTVKFAQMHKGGVRHHVGCVVCGLNEDALVYKACARCNSRQYCSVRCQTADWKCLGHRAACKDRAEHVAAGGRETLTSLVTGDKGPATRVLSDDAEHRRTEGTAALGEGRHEDALSHYLFAVSAAHGAVERARSDGDEECEWRARRIAAIAATNISILLRREAEAALGVAPAAKQPCSLCPSSKDMADMTVAVALSYAREARRFDDTYALKAIQSEHRLLKRQLASFPDYKGAFLYPDKAADTCEYLGHVVDHVKSGVKFRGPGSENVALLQAEYLSLKSYARLEEQRFEDTMAKSEASLFWAPRQPFRRPPGRDLSRPPAEWLSLPGWGVASVEISLVPMREQIWIALSLKTVTHDDVAMSVRLRCADRHADCDCVTIDDDRHLSRGDQALGMANTKSRSRVGTRLAHRNAERHLLEFVGDCAARGVDVVSVVLGCGCFGLHPVENANVDAALPDVTFIYANNHVMTDMRLGLGDASGEMTRAIAAAEHAMMDLRIANL